MSYFKWFSASGPTFSEAYSCVQAQTLPVYSAMPLGLVCVFMSVSVGVCTRPYMLFWVEDIPLLYCKYGKQLGVLSINGCTPLKDRHAQTGQ